MNCTGTYCAWQRPPTTRPTTSHVWKTRGCQCSFRLLMMDGVSPETCWASYKYGIIKFWYIVASCWIFLYELYYDARIHEHQVYLWKSSLDTNDDISVHILTPTPQQLTSYIVRVHSEHSKKNDKFMVSNVFPSGLMHFSGEFVGRHGEERTDRLASWRVANDRTK